MLKSEPQIASLLHDKGEQKHKDLADAFRNRIQGLAISGTFELYIADAIIWAEFAKDEDEFLRHTIDYLVTGNKQQLKMCLKFAGRGGPDALKDILSSWRDINNELDRFSRTLGSVDVRTCSADKVVRLPQKAVIIQKGSQYPGVGPWLLLGPFKLLMLQRGDLWAETRVDDLLMPLGEPVVAGVKKLLSNNYHFGSSLSAANLSASTTGFLKGIDRAYSVRAYSARIARLVNGREMHVNTGLHLLGENEISL